ncbi:hypothetical protein JHK86_033944 [Glycine max]|nr:hypothetical protein JHK86_033944 [Glycine max]
MTWKHCLLEGRFCLKGVGIFWTKYVPFSLNIQFRFVVTGNMFCTDLRLIPQPQLLPGTILVRVSTKVKKSFTF